MLGPSFNRSPTTQSSSGDLVATPAIGRAYSISCRQKPKSPPPAGTRPGKLALQYSFRFQQENPGNV